ncbi:MAG: prepilin peptidase [Chloroflexi bacterium]|nr:prepilin peptidase [Chloroflexota bacterium]
MTHHFFARMQSTRAFTVMVFSSIAFLAAILVSARALPFPTELSTRMAFGAMVVLFGWISLNDFRTRRVPNSVTYPLMLVGLGRAVSWLDATFLFYWVVLFTVWQLRFMGGGDAKLLMGLFGLFPDFELAWFVALSILVTGLPYLAYKYRYQWRAVPRRLFWRVITCQFLPSSAEFEKESVPYAFSFCLAGAAYMVMQVVQ